MELTREQAIKGFREHWDWLSWNPSKKKEEYPNIKDKRVLHKCYLCHFTSYGTMDQECKLCPVEWPKTDKLTLSGTPCLESYYGEWEDAKTPAEKSRLAALISKLPEKQEEKPDLKVGDWVRVKEDLVVGKQYDNGCIFRSEMEAYKDKITTVIGVRDNLYGNRYSLDNFFFSWSDSMLELAPSINQCPEPYTLTESTTFKFNGNKTTCIIEIDGRKFKGCAKCDPADEWNEETGKHWAELRAQRKLLDACEKDLRKRGQHA